jgi:predicted phosphodiesterase
MRGLEADPDAPGLRAATRAAFRNLVALALEERVAFVLIAGDLYDGDWQDWRTGLFFTEQVARLAHAGIPVVMIKGNHDAASVITRHLRLPEGVGLLPHDHCGRVVLDDCGVAIHGQSFATKSVGEDLTRHYPAPLPGFFNIGLLHTALTGRPGHADYAPASIEGLVARGYDYWALGHVHAREVVRAGDPWIVFPGNLQGRQAREDGPKGASLVTVEDGLVTAVEHRALDAVRWARLRITLGDEADLDAALARLSPVLAAALDAAEGRPLAARVMFCGPTRLHAALLGAVDELRQGVIAEGRHFGADRVWIEEVRLATTPLSGVEALRNRPDAIGRLVDSLDHLIAEGCGDLLGDYPQRLRDRIPGIELPSDHPLASEAAERRVLLAAARDLVLARLAQET